MPQIDSDVPRALQLQDQVARKVFRRLMWFLSLLFVCSYLDRINIGFASLSMNRELGLSATMFGVASTTLYIAYIFAEIPSNMLMARVGARLWIPRIMITWGIASLATVFATGPRSLYLVRGLVGLAEAGFMPGVLLYMTYWFPQSYRARASTMFILAQPLTIAFGSLLSAALLRHERRVGDLRLAMAIHRRSAALDSSGSGRVFLPERQARRCLLAISTGARVPESGS